MFNIDLLQSNLKTQYLGKKNYYYSTTSSTNDDIWKVFKETKREGIVIVANEQLNGRGREDKKWFSKKNKSLICSFLIKQNFSTEKLGLHAILIPVGIILGIEKTINKSLNIKWPNDIIFKNQKVCGILIETKKYNKSLYLNIGFGINVNENKNDFPKLIQKHATSLKIIYGQEIQRENLLANILNCIDKLLLEKTDKKIINAWQKYCPHINQSINIKYNNKIINATFIRLNNNGQAIVNYKNQEIIYDGAILNT